jgi:uncharacterized repeat protein (TIGR03803 family)
MPHSRLLIDSAGNLYGTTGLGGYTDKAPPQGDGTLFRIDAGTGVLATMVRFEANSGRHPIGDLISDAAGNLYGATNAGGPNGVAGGTIYKFDPATSSLTVLASFNGTVGNLPVGGLVADAMGNLYGETTYGNAIGDTGLVYKLSGSGFLIPEPENLGPVALSILLPLMPARRRMRA